jgi:hypothetical protein
MVRRWSRIGHLVSTWVFVAALVVQVFLAGLGLFAGAENWRTHVDFGYSAVWIVILLLPVFALLARLPRREVGLSFLLLALYIPQCLLPPLVRAGGPGFIAAFHPVNALLMFVLGVRIGLRAWQEIRQTSEATRAATS